MRKLWDNNPTSWPFVWLRTRGENSCRFLQLHLGLLKKWQKLQCVQEMENHKKWTDFIQQGRTSELDIVPSTAYGLPTNTVFLALPYPLFIYRTAFCFVLPFAVYGFLKINFNSPAVHCYNFSNTYPDRYIHINFWPYMAVIYFKN